MGKISSAAIYGAHVCDAEIEIKGAGGDPTIAILWLPDAAANEGRERVTTAFANSEHFWSGERQGKLISHWPILRKKEPSFYLSIALGMIAVTEELDSSPFENFRLS